jgi:hypothetical protein
MKNQKQSLGYWIVRRFKTAPAQSMVEFALALPVLLLATFGVIEFGRLMQAWLALENGARFGVRYAVTGEYNKKYCPAAYDALATSLSLTADNGKLDCQVVAPGASPTEAQLKAARDATQALEDWARLPSIRDATIGGASGIAYNKDVAGDDDYLAYLKNATNTFSFAYLGDPSMAGFVMVSTCSSRAKDGTRFYTYSSSSSEKHYFNTFTDDTHLYFPSICALGNPPPQKYIDDAGGPGDTVQVNITYRHNMITPLISEWWPSLRLNTSRKGIVEKFRTSRITGLSDTESEMGFQTYTFTPSLTLTPSITNTFTITNTPTQTFTNTPTETPTSTATATNTLVPCPLTGTGLTSEFFNWDTEPASPITLAPILISTVETVDKDWGGSSPGTSINANKFAARFSGFVYPSFTGKYTFRVRTDDGSTLSINSSNLVNNWQSSSVSDRSGEITLNRCTKYPISLEMMQGNGGSYAHLSWTAPNGTEEIIPKKYLFPSTATMSTASPTPSPTFTPTRTPTLVPCSDTGNGLRGEYYNYSDRNNAFASLPLVVRIDTTVDFDWAKNSPIPNVINKDNFAVRWYGEVMPLASEVYTFTAETDDGARLTIGTTSLFNDWTHNGTKTGTISLNRCQRYLINLEYNENTGNASAHLKWSSPSQSIEIIPMRNLFGTLNGAPNTAVPTNTHLSHLRVPTHR